MLITIQQTQANFKNRFEIKINGQTTYLADAPWLSLQVPLQADRLRPCTMTDIYGNLCYTTAYPFTENITQDAVPMRWVFTGKDKTQIFDVLDQEKQICGRFYHLTNGFMDSKYVIEFGPQVFQCYDIAVGRTRNLSVYLDSCQIAEIVKPLSVSNNLDCYYLFLLEEYSDLNIILSFFVIYFDARNYANQGQAVSGKRATTISYSYSKNNRFYNKNWITDNFESGIEILASINKEAEQMKQDLKFQSKRTLLFLAFIWGIVLITALIILGILML